MKKLQLSPTLALPLEAAGQTIGILGIRGGGKTNTAGVIAEELLDAHIPICVIDPTDAWWGLRSNYPVVMFGGDHGDVPLMEESGKDVAEFIVRERQPVILSIQHLSHAAQRRFVADTLLELYRLKAKDAHRYPLTVLIDEAPLFIPQRVMGESARCVGAVENLVARGRKSGFGVVLISQRSATINKDVLTQADTMIVHRLTGLPDRKVLAEWMDANATTGRNKETLAELAGLQKGDAWVWAPELDVYQRTHIRLRRTFDSSASPKIGKRLKPPKRMAKIDLKALGQRLQESVERRKENDPAALRRENVRLTTVIGGLHAQIKKLETAKPPKVVTKEIHVAVIPKPFLHKLARVEKEVSELQIMAVDHVRKEHGGPLLAPKGKPHPEVIYAATPGGKEKMEAALATYPPRRPTVVKDISGATENSGNISKTAKRILQELASRYPTAWNKVQIGAILGIKGRTGSFANRISELTTRGFIERAGDGFKATEAGIAHLGGDVPETPADHAAVMERWNRVLSGTSMRLLELLADIYPAGITKNEAGQRLGISGAAGSFANRISELTTAGLAERRGGQLFASATLWPEGR